MSIAWPVACNPFRRTERCLVALLGAQKTTRVVAIDIWFLRNRVGHGKTIAPGSNQQAQKVTLPEIDHSYIQ
jgi:hypothetical protein